MTADIQKLLHSQDWPCHIVYYKYRCCTCWRLKNFINIAITLTFFHGASQIILSIGLNCSNHHNPFTPFEQNKRAERIDAASGKWGSVEIFRPCPPCALRERFTNVTATRQLARRCGSLLIVFLGRIALVIGLFDWRLSVRWMDALILMGILDSMFYDDRCRRDGGIGFVVDVEWHFLPAW